MAMQIKSYKNRQTYIKDLELAIPDAILDKLSIGELKYLEDKADAKVVLGSTVSFLDGVPMIRQQDVLNSTLLAQLASNFLYDREKETILWYTKYKEVLENVGWVIQNFSFANQTSDGTSVRMDKVALKIIGAAVSGNALVILTATLKALEDADPNSKEITLFDTNGSGSDGGNFQTSIASLDPNNNIQMSLGAFYFKSSERHTRFLFWSWSTKSINIYVGTQSIILNEQIYSTVRQAIIDKLGDKAVRYVADLPI